MPISLTCRRMNAMSPHHLTPSKRGLIRLDLDRPAIGNGSGCRLFRILGESGYIPRDRWRQRFYADAAS
ncbi:hypothetical protein RISK_003037 [Rhodopirellula islandica]|uniref:Uncharacterized protein n=1 Tax=Rhodopirellula islandica TaxID=595434 RepID=A0A0J1EGV0_RHOIS|nr:hypothetical protein RISK_003037 [Rhodopirellula islandica]